MQPRGKRQGQPEDPQDREISVQADEMSVKLLELTKDVVKNLAEWTHGTMVVSTDEFEILVLGDQYAGEGQEIRHDVGDRRTLRGGQSSGYKDRPDGV